LKNTTPELGEVLEFENFPYVKDLGILGRVLIHCIVSFVCRCRHKALLDGDVGFLNAYVLREQGEGVRGTTVDTRTR
jgi:hypothetical protein